MKYREDLKSVKSLSYINLLGNLPLFEAVFFLLISSLMVFNYGATLLKFPFTKIPLPEFLIAIALFKYLITERNFFQIIQKNIFFIPCSLLLIQATLGILNAFNEYGIYSFRTATHIVDLTSLFIGIKYGRELILMKSSFLIFRLSLFAGVIYFLTFPFKEMLYTLSPQITNISGESIRFLFYYDSLAKIAATGFAFNIFQKKIKYLSLNFILSTCSIFIMLFLDQRRSTYFLLILLYIFYIFYKKSKNITIFLLPIIFILLGYFFIQIFGFEGRISESISIDFIKNHFLSSFAFNQSQNFDVMSGDLSGASLRFQWWINVINKIIENPIKLIFGLGQGIPLTNLHLSRFVTVLEPHNSTISILGRYGVLGLISFLFIQINLFRILLRKIKFVTNQNLRNYYYTFLFFFSAILLDSLAQDTFEKPYFAIPYYFFWGIIVSNPLIKKNNN